MKQLVALIMCTASLFSAAQCYEHPCELPPNTLTLTPSGEVWYNISHTIGGIQFGIEGATVLEIYAQDLQAAGFSVSTNGSFVIAFSVVGNTIPPGCGVLMMFELSGGSFASITELQVLNPVGDLINTSVVEPCSTSGILGCTDSTACNYDSTATQDDGSCLQNDDCGVCGGDNSSCSGCTDSTACNYDSTATQDDGSCVVNDDCGVCGGDNSSCSGCTHENATNYDSTATIEDGSCLFSQDAYDAGFEAGAASVECPPCANSGCQGDFTADGYIGVDDILFMLSLYDTYCWQCGDPISYQGYDYSTVLIGEQCWFAENLRNENYNNGDVIPAGLSDSDWQNTASGAVSIYGEGSYPCVHYSPDIDACDPTQSLNEYGRLYNWYAVDDPRGLCPSGWHVPSDAEWMTMEIALGMSEADSSTIGYRGTDQGSQMKTTYGWTNSHSWNNGGNGNGTNSSGFSGLPGSYRYYNGYSPDAGESGVWWTSSSRPVNNGTWGWKRTLFYQYQSVLRSSSFLNDGYSVRCIKDAE